MCTNTHSARVQQFKLMYVTPSNYTLTLFGCTPQRKKMGEIAIATTTCKFKRQQHLAWHKIGVESQDIHTVCAVCNVHHPLNLIERVKSNALWGLPQFPCCTVAFSALSINSFHQLVRSQNQFYVLAAILQCTSLLHCMTLHCTAMHFNSHRPTNHPTNRPTSPQPTTSHLI